MGQFWTVTKYYDICTHLKHRY